MNRWYNLWMGSSGPCMDSLDLSIGFFCFFKKKLIWKVECKGEKWARVATRAGDRADLQTLAAASLVSPPPAAPPPEREEC